MQQFGLQAMSASASAMRGISAILGWAILPVYFAYFLTAGSISLDAEQFLPFLKPDTRKDVVYLLKEFIGIVVAFFRAT